MDKIPGKPSNGTTPPAPPPRPTADGTEPEPTCSECGGYLDSKGHCDRCGVTQ